MKTENKTFIKLALLSGLTFAGLMAGFDYYEGEEFDLWKFIIHFLFFGFFMGWVNRNNQKERKKEDKAV